MTIHAYIMPTVLTVEDPTIHPKYFFQYSPEMRGLMKCKFMAKTLNESAAVIFADVTPEQHTELKSYPDVIGFPDGVDIFLTNLSNPTKEEIDAFLVDNNISLPSSIAMMDLLSVMKGGVQDAYNALKGAI